MTPHRELAATALDALSRERVEARSLPESPVSAARVRTAGWRLADLWLPAVVLDRDALEHNLARMRAWCEEHGVDLAPHGKTTMAPQLWSAQLAAGAWGLTAATAAQARTMRRFGASRILLANELVDPAGLRWAAAQLADPDAQLCCLVDSPAGLALMERVLAEARPPRPLPVLVELGVPGRRTGVRKVGRALELAAGTARSHWVELAGVEGYEGVVLGGRAPDALAAVRRFLADLTTLAAACDREGLFAGRVEVLLSAGGSAYFDLVAEAVAALPALSVPVRTVVRTGCALTHDHLAYERLSPLRSGAEADPLRPALLLYATVLSCPEPRRALVGFGRRDASFDLGLPLPLAVHRGGLGGPRELLHGTARIVELNDQHAFCDQAPEALRTGDVLELGLSHPCTVFDKWPLIPIVDRSRTVIDAVRTLF